MARPKTKLEWIILDDEKDWSPSKAAPPRRRHKPGRVVLGIVLASLLLILGAVLAWRYRLAQIQGRLKIEFQRSVNLEAQAVANGDRELFFSLKSRDNIAWIEWQHATFEYLLRNPGNWPHLRVTRVEWMDDCAWVHVRGTLGESHEQFEWVRFYRLQDGVWLEVPPDARYWGDEREKDVGPLHFVYYERDEPHLAAIAERITELMDTLCEGLGCSDDLEVTVQLVLPYPLVGYQVIESAALVLPSPSVAPHPTFDPQLSLDTSVSYMLVPYLAFEAAGGQARWEASSDGAWLVSAVADWAREKLWEEFYELDPYVAFESNRALGRLIVRNGPLPSLEQMWRGERRGAVPSIWSLPYPTMVQVYAQPGMFPGAHAMALIEYIVETHGEQVIPDLLSAIARNYTLDGALYDALGVDLETFESAWQNWLQENYGSSGG